MGDVVELAARRMPTPDEAKEQLTSVDVRLRDLRKMIVGRVGHLEVQLGWERYRRRRAERELLEERRRAFHWSDEQVLGALREAGPRASATAVVAVLYGTDSPHHLRVRAGLALARLRMAGSVTGYLVGGEGRGAYRWTASEA